MSQTPPPGLRPTRQRSPLKPARRRSPLKVVLVVLASLVALVLLGVVGLLAWAQFRPLLPADYTLANNRVGTVGEQVNFVGETVGQAATVLPQGDQEVIEASAQSVRDQVGLADDAAQELGELRAVSDPEVERQVEAIQQGVSQMQTYLRGYADAMVPTAEMNAACAAWVQDPETRVDSGASRDELDAAVADCEEQAAAIRDAGGGAWSQVGDAQLVLIEGTRDAFDLLESDPEGYQEQYAAQRQAREDYELAVAGANTALADELAEVGAAATDPVNELGRYTSEQAAG